MPLDVQSSQRSAPTEFFCKLDQTMRVINSRSTVLVVVQTNN